MATKTTKTHTPANAMQLIPGATVGEFFIASASKPGTFYHLQGADTYAASCTCPDFTWRRRECKHLRTLALALAAVRKGLSPAAPADPFEGLVSTSAARNPNTALGLYGPAIRPAA